MVSGIKKEKMNHRKTIALVAHDQRKPDLLEWVSWNANSLLKHHLVCTGTTGKLVEELLTEKDENQSLSMQLLKSGPLGGDQQLGAMITENKIDIIVFFWEPMEAQAHDSDVKALLRVAVLYNVVIACSRSTADFIITSPLMETGYENVIPTFENYENRVIIEKKMIDNETDVL